MSSIKNEHSHELNSDMSRLMPPHKKLTPNIKRTLVAHDIAHIRTCKSVQLLQIQSGGLENLGCLSKDCRNYIENHRMLRLGNGNAEAIQKLFVNMQ